MLFQARGFPGPGGWGAGGGAGAEGAEGSGLEMEESGGPCRAPGSTQHGAAP